MNINFPTCIRYYCLAEASYNVCHWYSVSKDNGCVIFYYYYECLMIIMIVLTLQRSIKTEYVEFPNNEHTTTTMYMHTN